MRLTVKASEVRAGDVLIVPDGELVVVERPEPPVTITVELTPAEADAWVANWPDQHAWNSYEATAMKVRDAIRAARGQ